MRYASMAALAFMVSPVFAWGQIVSERQILMASDAAERDWFGNVSAANENYILFGVQRADAVSDDVFEDAGAAYVFDAVTGQQLHKLTSSASAEMDLFGNAVAVSGNLGFVGAYRADYLSPGINDGAVFVYDLATGQELNVLHASDATAGTLFGTSVGANDTRLVVGAIGDRNAGITSGAAYVFDIATGQQLYKLIPHDAEAGKGFGMSVAVSGSLVLIGAPWDNENIESSGAAYVFDLETGQELYKLKASDNWAQDEFGRYVALDGNRALIGAYWDNDAGNNSGSAYVFDTSTGQQVRKLTASDAARFDTFGQGVALRGNIAIITAPQSSKSGGAAYIFDLTTGQEVAKFTASNIMASDFFGASVAMTDSFAVIGARASSIAATEAGAAYIFDFIPSCPADTNNDGILSPADFTAWIAGFNTSAPECDQNDDGLCTPADFTAWIANYNAGC